MFKNTNKKDNINLSSKVTTFYISIKKEELIENITTSRIPIYFKDDLKYIDITSDFYRIDTYIDLSQFVFYGSVTYSPSIKDLLYTKSEGKTIITKLSDKELYNQLIGLLNYRYPFIMDYKEFVICRKDKESYANIIKFHIDTLFEDYNLTNDLKDIVYKSMSKENGVSGKCGIKLYNKLKMMKDNNISRDIIISTLINDIME